MTKQWQSYVIVNIVLVIVWLLTGAGYFWPIWLIAFWGASLVVMQFHFNVPDRAITEEEIQKEINKTKEFLARNL